MGSLPRYSEGPRLWKRIWRESTSSVGRRKLGADCARERENVDIAGAGGQQHPDTGRKSGAGGMNIVDDNDALPLDAMSLARMNGDGPLDRVPSR
jgi:hypothetical protein